ncbi:iron ABC transporter permease [Peribacillus saganii]|uniref:Iron ABC transporter permease n=1 Tax=Peribacillus saganii TaxID=2303992 RepID=A0A372L9N9_9BACI|nr:iron ABC transporter permease [Peribacillus saganii]RFU62249.1 iron ABC transporter permease [Peribacillus saganii]
MKLFRLMKLKMNSWAILSFLITIIIMMPILFITFEFFTRSSENWEHINEYLLNSYLFNTLLILFFTGLLTVFIGVSMAWFISAYDFPLRGFFKWGLILPLAIPPYIGAYTYNGILNYTGVIQSILRNFYQIEVNQKYFNIMSIPGAIFIFSVFLFPYVYLITKNFLENQSASLVENARLLGSNSFEIFFRIVIPISRASIVAGVSLVILEVLNDYGVVKYFGIQTLSTAIFQTWFGMADLGSAIKLSGILMMIVVVILMAEKWLRGRKKYSYSNSKVRPLKPVKLTGYKAWAIFAYISAVFLLSFFIPFIQLVKWTFTTYKQVLSDEFIGLIWNSTFVAFTAAAVIVVIALIIANFSRLFEGRVTNLVSKIVVLGYSIPGAVIAIGVLTLFIALDRQLLIFYQLIGLTPSLVLSLSLSMLIFAFVIRFMAIGYNSIETGFDKIGTTFTEASRTLGMTVTQTFFKVDLKMIKGAVAGGFILVFIEILKELPLTLILQPFNFYTLATKAFQYAGDERIQEAASASILIILISGVSIYIFHKVLEKEPG